MGLIRVVVMSTLSLLLLQPSGSDKFLPRCGAHLRVNIGNHLLFDGIINLCVSQHQVKEGFILGNLHRQFPAIISLVVHVTESSLSDY